MTLRSKGDTIDLKHAHFSEKPAPCCSCEWKSEKNKDKFLFLVCLFTLYIDSILSVSLSPNGQISLPFLLLFQTFRQKGKKKQQSNHSRKMPPWNYNRIKVEMF